MSMTDPVADLLTRIRNGYRAKQDKVDVPASRLKANIVKVGMKSSIDVIDASKKY